jgi:uncharacterized protein
MRSRTITTAGFALALLTAWLWGLRYVFPYRPRLEHVAIELPDGAEALAGLRIAFITDIHAGPFIDATDVRRASALIDHEVPDLVLLGGDYISESPRHLSKVAPALGELCRGAALGGYAVLGNHDIFVSWSAVTASLEAEGITVLRNEAAEVHWNGGSLWVVGIDETLHGCPDPDQAFASVPNGAAALVLWHEPEFAEQSAAHGAFAQLSGHTHGGQMRLPGIRPGWLPRHGRKNVTGANIAGHMPVYTSRGVGVYRPPMRLNCPPEVTLVTLIARSRPEYPYQRDRNAKYLQKCSVMR